MGKRWSAGLCFGGVNDGYSLKREGTKGGMEVGVGCEEKRRKKEEKERGGSGPG